MRRLTNLLLFFWLFVLTAIAQDFKLYYAKNVGDVTDFSSTRKIAQQLSWKEVTNGSIDGNAADVNAVTDMLKQTRMKGLDDQRLFWKMRDETLLAFRINDGSGTSGIYDVEIDYGVNTDEGNPYRLTLSTSSYFFANMPLFTAENHITISVKKKGSNDQPMVFRYWVFDWDNDDVYIFQLDQKRQATGNTYRMEYVTTYTDSNDELQTQHNTLELQSTHFQSFFLPEGHTLTDVFFLTGNETEGYNKIRMNMDYMHSGIDIDKKMEIPRLETKFNLTKHENRELMNFNWLGTGLFEKYDTLFMQLFREDGSRVTEATINVHRVDAKGNYVDDAAVEYLGYDAGSRSHLIHTYANPAYIEILVPGCLPTLYRYKGAAEADTRILDEDLCTAKLTLKAGQPDANGIAISDQHLRCMADLHLAVTRDNIDYALCEERDYDLSGRAPVEVIAYMENGGVKYPKLLNNKPTEKFAQMEVTFSCKKGDAEPACRMTAKEVESNKVYTVTVCDTKVVSSNVFSRFTRDYYFSRFDLIGMPYNIPLALTLHTPSSNYEGFPRIQNSDIDIDQAEKSAEDHADGSMKTPDDSDQASRSFEDSGFGFGYAPSFNFKLPKCQISTGYTLDITQQLFNWYIQLIINGVDPAHDTPKQKTARDAAQSYASWNKRTDKYTKEGSKVESSAMTLAGGKEKLKDWVAKEANDIFTINPAHIGWYFGGGVKVAVGSKLTSEFPFIKDPQLSEVSGYFEGGFGWFFGPTTNGYLGKVKKAVDLFPLDVDFGAVFDANARLDVAFKSFTNNAMSLDNFGFFAGLGVSAKAGAWAGLRVKRNPLVDLGFNLRAGAKLAAEAGLATPFQKGKVCAGTRLTMLALVEANVYMRSFFCHASWQAGWKWGEQLFFPDNGHNPYHKDFPYWIPKTVRQRTVAEAYRALRAPAPSDMGRALVTDVAINANPHFVDEEHVVYNAMGEVGDYNDDHVAMIDLTGNDRPVSISSTGLAAGQHMRSKRGKPEIIAYQQVCSTVNSAEITSQNSVRKNNEQQQHTQIKAAINMGDEVWTETIVTPDDGFVDKHPVVTIQEDGKAAVVYEHGNLELISDTLSADSIYSYCLNGELLLRTYEPGKGWSEATHLFDINDKQAISQYDLFMRGDTVLVGANLIDLATEKNRLTYASKPLDGSPVSYVDEQIAPYNFFMNRVGQNAVIAMAYERSDSLHEVYVKTLAMNGQGDGRAGCDLGVGRCNPERVKLICDRSDDNTDDFAVLWTEANNIVRDPAEGSYSTENMGTILNASRIHLSETPAITYPITVAAATDSLLLIDFDGYINDDLVGVVYTLADANSGAAVIMKSEKVFTNSFEADVTYSREAMLASSALPVNVTIRNTGTSSINGAEVIINGTLIPIDDVFVAPLSKKVFTVQYPLTDDFSGYMESVVNVTYDNVFRKARQVTRRGAARDLRRGMQMFERERVAYNDIDCRIVNRHIDATNGRNTFLIELTDRSTYGLLPNTGMMVGIHPHLGMVETFNQQAQALVTDDDFQQMGNVRKAFVRVYVDGITEMVDAYIFPTIVDLGTATVRRRASLELPIDEDGIRRIDTNAFGDLLSETGGSESDLIIRNSTAGRNASAVTLYPSGDPTYIDALRLGNAQTTHQTQVERTDGGIRLLQIQKGSNVRVFTLEGYLIFNEPKTAATTLRVPLPADGIYIISTGQEVFKYQY